MKSRILVRVVASLITLGMVGTNLVGDSKKPDNPPPFQIFEIYSFTAAEANCFMVVAPLKEARLPPRFDWFGCFAFWFRWQSEKD